MTKKIYTAIVAFSTPSGKLHIGHALGQVAGHATALYESLKHNSEIFFPMGVHATGKDLIKIVNDIKSGIEPQRYGLNSDVAESIKNSPAQEDISTLLNYYKTTYQKDLTNLGIDIDLDAYFSTSDPENHAYTQWTIRKLAEQGLIVKTKAHRPYCNECKEVKAIEQDQSEVYAVGDVDWNQAGIEQGQIIGGDGTYNMTTTGVDDDKDIFTNTPKKLATDINTLEGILKYTTPNTGKVTAIFYDAAVREVGRIEDDVPAGTHNIRLPTNVASGVYFYIINAGGEVRRGKYSVVDGHIGMKGAEHINQENIPSGNNPSSMLKTTGTASIEFRDIRPEPKYELYIDDKIDPDTLKTYDNVAYPKKKLEIPFGGLGRIVTSLLDLTHEYIADDWLAYTNGAIVGPVQIYLNRSEDPLNWAPHIRKGIDSTNSLLEFKLGEESETPYNEYQDDGKSHIEMSYQHMDAYDATIRFYMSRKNKICAQIIINTSRSFTHEEIISTFLHEYIYRFGHLGGTAASSNRPKEYIGCDGERTVYPHNDEILEMKILNRINQVPQRVEIGFYKQTE